MAGSTPNIVNVKVSLSSAGACVLFGKAAGASSAFLSMDKLKQLDVALHISVSALSSAS